MLTKKVMLLPTEPQKQMLFKSAGAMRFIFNECKSLSEYLYKTWNMTLTENELEHHFKNLKKTCPDACWLKECSADIIKQACKDYVIAKKNSFRTHKHGFGTRYKSKHDLHQSFYSDYVKTKVKKKAVYISMTGQGLKISKKERDSLCIIRTSEQLPMNIKLSNPRVTFDGLSWWISIGFPAQEHKEELTNEVIGVDLGLKETLIAINTSGEVWKVKNINKTKRVKKLLSKKRAYQHQMSKRYVKGSREQSTGYYKAKVNHLKVSRKITNIRDNEIHQITTRLARTKPKRIVVEDLNVSGMMKNKKLSKAISYQKFNFLINCLAYKCRNRGIELVKADRWFASSKICHVCKTKYDHSRQNGVQWSLKIREWTCSECNAHHDRDINAAINLRNWY